jgi:hypothetical protein
MSVIRGWFRFGIVKCSAFVVESASNPQLPGLIALDVFLIPVMVTADSMCLSMGRKLNNKLKVLTASNNTERYAHN